MRVDNSALRDYFLNSGLSATEVARRCNWTKPGNSSRVLRALGVRPYKDDICNKRIKIENALLLAEAMGADPIDVGL
jgi:hypothetical protein